MIQKGASGKRREVNEMRGRLETLEKKESIGEGKRREGDRREKSEARGRN